ncbi:hypothetical protein PL263_12570 [Methylomonas sp. EFPC3]|uniref:hypothetical protein n=1 Tax=Methylomonas sp. EFPC3 TaxID=3021710 RepID=UPI0024163CBC|nr:hypothetical protein [Methylomonas sp. EFPC3]WFP48940.1 hypothetical protein PL263_12570 [Methylomonas sp. EFPC3]
MKNNNTLRTAGLTVLCGLWLMPAWAEHSEHTVAKTQAPPVEEVEYEFYDYHAGITYPGTLQNYLFRHSEKTQPPGERAYPELEYHDR